MPPTPPPYTFEQLGFPPQYLIPIQTPHGLAWPGPKIRVLLDDIENIQKRMVNIRVQANPLRLKQVLPKNKRAPEYERLKAQFALLQNEMGAATDRLAKFPASKEQFIAPMEIPIEGMPRVIKEHWVTEYKDAMEERSDLLKEAAEENENPTPPPPKLGTFLPL